MSDRPVELNGVKFLKSHAQLLSDRTGEPGTMWFQAQDYLANIHNLSANRQINWQIPQQVSRGGTPDISHILMFYWFEPVLYLDPVAKFPETTERPGYFVGFADNVGDNVGDVAGMSADLFGSFAESTCASLVISSSSLIGYGRDCEY